MRSRSLLLVAGLAAAALLAPGQAHAYKLLGKAWSPDAMPLPYCLSDYVEDSVPEGYPAQAIQNAYDEWSVDAPCTGLGGVNTGSACPSGNVSWTYDHSNSFTFDDPGNANAAGVLAATKCFPQGNGGTVLEIVDGQQIYESYDCDIVYNDQVDWATDDDIRAGNCNGETSMQAVTTHEIGHSWGLGHSCDEGEACADPEKLEATMYWTAGACDLQQATINEDDKRGINALYGPHVSIECDREVDPEDPNTIAVGNVPFDIKCTATPSEQAGNVDTIEWRWGDGQTSTGDRVSHTYETAGNFTLEVVSNGHNEQCGDWDDTTHRVGYVRACDVPEPEFSYVHSDGLTYQLKNETDISVYGCIYDIEWDIFDPSGNQLEPALTAWEPEFTFPEEGDYRVVLNIGGPAGTGAAEMTIHVENTRGEESQTQCGCDSDGAAGGLGVASLVGALALVRRRRA